MALTPRLVTTLTVAAVLAACSDPLERVPTGIWGGEHLSMIVTDSGATLEYDCAVARIRHPLTLRSDGGFTWVGDHFPGHGGPSNPEIPSNAYLSFYGGVANRDRMSITVSIPDLTEVPSKYSLVRGNAGTLFKCL